VKAEEAMRAGQNCSGSQAREQGWAIRMRAAMSGDAGAYREFLESVAPAVRLLVRRAGGDDGLSMNQVEEEVQRILLAIRKRWRGAARPRCWTRGVSGGQEVRLFGVASDRFVVVVTDEVTADVV
jgi:hypothetical protein